MDTFIQPTDDTSHGERIIALAQFILERKEAIEAGAYDVEIVDVTEGSLLELVSFGISAKQNVRFKINIDLRSITT